VLKQTIKYKDLDENELEEDFYFHLNKAEVAKFMLQHGGGKNAENFLQSIIDSKDGQKIIDTFEMIVKMSYGVRSENGKTFIKNDKVWNEFFQSDAYSEFFYRLCTEADFGAKFVNGIMPADLLAQASAELLNSDSPMGKAMENVELPSPTPKDYSALTRQQLMELPREELVEAMKQKLTAKPVDPREPYGYENGQNIL
jgi:hypothetical protein